ncbi:PD-(D/E)XK nuclease family protein [Neobacillus sp. SCS-31]|uniref:PD-(D/E)XK nuclease family protein n=1 Tax=Neobacillus oceani TaxID=3115292 RepID=UPI0039063DEA
MNIIRLLNSFYREDVITDMIAYMINEDPGFAEWFTGTLCGQEQRYSKIKAYTRIGLGKGIGTPDLIIESDEYILVIENKLGALEGTDQTNRYASEEGKMRLRSAFKKPETVPIHFYFLTLDPFTPATNPDFKKLDYKKFVGVDWGSIIQDTDAVKIMSDYSALLKEFYNPLQNAALSDSIAETTRELDVLQRKLIWIHMLQQAELPAGMEMTFGEAGGFGRNAAVFLFSKKEWRQERFNGKVLMAQSMNLHFELAINLLAGNTGTDFSVHYEPHPYKPKKDYERVAGYKDYENLRKERARAFHELINQLDRKTKYRLRNGSNSILKINLGKTETFRDIIDEIVGAIGELSPLLEKIVGEKI